MTMNISIPSILLSLGGKCLLNWTLVFIQRNHICKSFLGVFSVSISVIDTILPLFITTIHLCTRGYIVLLGLKLTKFHVCLLVQILGQVYSCLQWPVVVLAGLDHFCTHTRRLQPSMSRARGLVYLFITSFLWNLTAGYVFLVSDFTPVLEDVSYEQIQHCWVFHSSQILLIALSLLLTLSCAALHARCCMLLMNDQNTDQRRTPSRINVVYKVIHIFLNTWALFLCFLAVLLVVPVGIPTYLDLNVAWLCFLNSFLIAVILCTVCPASQLAHGLAVIPPDSFCEWRFKFSLTAVDRTCVQQANSNYLLGPAWL